MKDYYKRLDKKVCEGFAPSEKNYNYVKAMKDAIVSHDENGDEFVLIPCEKVDEFVITCLSREDFRAQGYNPDNLSDMDMEDIADGMAEYFIEYGGYWDDLDAYACRYGCEEIETDEDEDYEINILLYK